MKKALRILVPVMVFLGCEASSSAYANQRISNSRDFAIAPDHSNTVLEPWTYSDNFEDRDLGAWASYPLWQDTAYDPNFRVNEMAPDDSNISIVQKVTPYTNVDNYAGAQKLLDMYLVPDATVRFRYYLKMSQQAEFFKVRFAGGDYGKIDVPVSAPQTNKWVWVEVTYNDVIRHNPELAGKDKIRIYALAFLTKIPDADPAMPFYLGLDDITFKGARATQFQFARPTMYKLPEYDPYIPEQAFHRGEKFTLSGRWPVGADRVGVKLASYTDKDQPVWGGQLDSRGLQWQLDPLELSFPEGLYLGTLTAYKGDRQLSTTEFTIHIAPDDMKGKHPRLMFDTNQEQKIKQRLKQDRFRGVYEKIRENAKRMRAAHPVDSLVYDLDQFPDEHWIPTLPTARSRIFDTGSALRWNARAYALLGDRQAGEYVKDVLVKLAGWPYWIHPWQIKRHRYSDVIGGSWSHRVAEAYDLTYDLMGPAERTKIRKAVMQNIIKGAHRTYIYNDNVTSKTSNWIAMVAGGSLMNMAAIYEDGPETSTLEPYFTGAMIKFYTFLERVTDSKDGAWGEGLGYNNFSFSNLTYSAPSLKNVFNIDVTTPLVGSYNEYIWAGLIKKRELFYFGDSGENLNPFTNWAFLLDMHRDPRMSWLYNYLKYGKTISNRMASNQQYNVYDRASSKYAAKMIQESQTYMDAIFDLQGIPQDSPFDESPVKKFRQDGTTVFKSGWEADDFSFAMRSGPFYNHQHMDQGTFWLADRGVTFIEERHGSTYYADPIYKSWYTQPVAHSTILIDGNHQSQRVGDLRKFAPGFEDHAFIEDFLNGKDAAFSSGNIGRLYWGKVQSMHRNVLYLKPRTLLMLDTVVPGNKDRKVTLLYQTEHLKDITASQDISTITKQGMSLDIMHLAPEQVDVQAVETPHYLYTLQDEHPLQKEGMLTVSARTSGSPLVMASLLTTTKDDTAPNVQTDAGKGYISGVASGKKFAFNTEPGNLYSIEDIQTDALALTWSDGRIFAAKVKTLIYKGTLIVESSSSLTIEYSADGTVGYYRSEAGTIAVRSASRPSSVALNGKPTKGFTYDNQRQMVIVNVPAGNGQIMIK